MTTTDRTSRLLMTNDPRCLALMAALGVDVENAAKVVITFAAGQLVRVEVEAMATSTDLAALGTFTEHFVLTPREA